MLASRKHKISSRLFFQSILGGFRVIAICSQFTPKWILYANFVARSLRRQIPNPVCYTPTAVFCILFPSLYSVASSSACIKSRLVYRAKKDQEPRHKQNNYHRLQQHHTAYYSFVGVDLSTSTIWPNTVASVTRNDQQKNTKQNKNSRFSNYRHNWIPSHVLNGTARNRSVCRADHFFYKRTNKRDCSFWAFCQFEFKWGRWVEKQKCGFLFGEIRYQNDFVASYWFWKTAIIFHLWF